MFNDRGELGPDADTASELCADGTFHVTLELPCPPWTGGGTRSCVDTCVVERHLAWVNGEVVWVLKTKRAPGNVSPVTARHDLGRGPATLIVAAAAGRLDADVGRHGDSGRAVARVRSGDEQ